MISIIIPIYNTGQKLERCLDSVMAQTYGDFECLMIDDGSTDASPDIIDDYAAKDARFIAIHQANAGVSSARNEGMKNAKGDWLVFLDSDDYIKPIHLESMILAIDDNIDIVFTGFEKEIEENKIIMGHKYKDAIYLGKDGISRFLGESDVLSYMIPWDRMYRRSIVGEANVSFDCKLSLAEDRLFCYQYLLHANGIATISSVTYVHDTSDHNTLSYRSYPFPINAYCHEVFVKATNDLILCYELSEKTIFALWKYDWNMMFIALSSLYSIKENIFKITKKQKEYFLKHFDWPLFKKIEKTQEFKTFAQNESFKIIFNHDFLKWNFSRSIDFLKYKLHISR